MALVITYFSGSECSVEAYYSLHQLGGAESLAGVFNALCDMREITPLFFGFAVGAKVGCGIVAELGTMRINEEIDALDAMGVPSRRFLVSTRMLAALVVLPLMYVLALATSFLASWIVQHYQIGLVSPALQQAEAVRKATGVAGEVDVVLTGPDVTTPVAVAWLGATEQSLEGPQLIGISRLPDFLLAFNYNQPPDAATTRTILDRLPTYFTGAVVSPDHHVAVVTLGVTGVNSVEEDRALVRRVEKAAGGVTAAVELTGARQTPLTALLAGVVVAFATEFGVLWLTRYRAERRAGETPELASEAASRRLGPAIVAAALALAAGFAALAGSQIPMLRAFGLWCAADLLLATVAVLVLLPPAARTWLR